MTDAQDRTDEAIEREFPNSPESPRFLTRAQRRAMRDKIDRRHSDDALSDPEWDADELEYLDDLRERNKRNRVLRQQDYWYDALGREVPLTSMSLRYKKNVVRYLERRAPLLQLQDGLASMSLLEQMSETNQDLLEAEIDFDMSKLPTTWLHEQPLLIMLERLIREGHDAPEIDPYFSSDPAGDPIDEFE